MQVVKQYLDCLNQLNYIIHTIEVNFLTQILFWIRITLLSLLQEKILHGLFPMTVENTSRTQLLPGIFSEPEQIVSPALMRT